MKKYLIIAFLITQGFGAVVETRAKESPGQIETGILDGLIEAGGSLSND